MKKKLISLSAFIVGMIGGFLYYKFVGCVSGACPITANPFLSTLLGGFMGYSIIGLLTDLFLKKKTQKNIINEEEK